MVSESNLKNHSSSPTTLKFPLSYAKAVSRPDAAVWYAAMEREKASLLEMGAFVEEDLLKGAKTIGLKWVYAYTVRDKTFQMIFEVELFFE